MPDGPLSAYRGLRGTGSLREDPGQELAAEKLQSLHNALRGYRAAVGRDTWRVRLGLERRPDAAPQGLYLYGGVGRGKSMLMDLFFGTAKVERKKRVHFHRFMLDAHAFLHAWRLRRKNGDPGDGLGELARTIAEEASLLCFDEFHVTNIADAMILGRLFTALFERGVVVVATSNWAPDDLYKDGLQRDLFLPFIALLKDRLDVLALEGGVDYRWARLRRLPVYHHPLGLETASRLAETFNTLTDGAKGQAHALAVQGRTLEVPFAAKGVAWFHYYDLCCKPLGAADYLTIATHFHSVILDQVPKLKAENRNEAKRLMTLIDALYEHRVNLVMAAEAPAVSLYPDGEHAFEFQRTVSRLMEMQTPEYIATAHLT